MIAQTIYYRTGKGERAYIVADDGPVVKRWANAYEERMTFLDGSVLTISRARGFFSDRGQCLSAYGGTGNAPACAADLLFEGEAFHRIRCVSSEGGGGPISYRHADVIASSAEDAMLAAQDFRLVNWRGVDRFDSSAEPFCYFEYLYEVAPDAAKRMLRPLRERREQDRDKRVILSHQLDHLKAGSREIADI